MSATEQAGKKVRARTLRCLLFGHHFYWLDVKRRHHCAWCGTTDLRYVLLNRRIREYSPRFGCDCPECQPQAVSA